MFLYQNRLLKAELLNGILETQQRMTDLYSANLNAVGTQAALIAGVTYLAINNCFVQVIVLGNWLSFWYNLFYAISMSAAMIMVSHTILASMLGPTKSLIGNAVNPYDKNRSFPIHIVSIHIFSYCPDSYVPTYIVSIQPLGIKFDIY